MSTAAFTFLLARYSQRAKDAATKAKFLVVLSGLVKFFLGGLRVVDGVSIDFALSRTSEANRGHRLADQISNISVYRISFRDMYPCKV